MKNTFSKAIAIAFLGGALVSCANNPQTTSDSSTSPILTVEGGQISGILAEGETDIYLYNGIPYAAAPVGELRWKQPQPVQPWEGVRDCSAYGASSLQSSQTEGSFYWREFYQEGDPERSEDCLFLNVCTPAAGDATKQLPVVVWIHGGAFNHGCGNELEFRTTAYAKKGVVLVTINYRVGILGFMAHPLLTAENGGKGSGNYGLFDQLAAIKWVKNNIAAFGGNPNNITIMGQSAGAMSVQSLISSPLSKGLIQRAVIQSGGGLGGFVRETASRQSTEERGEAMWKAAGINSLEEMRAYPAEELDALAAAVKQPNGYGLSFSPCVDGELLTASVRETALAGNELDIPYMIGSTSEDMMPDALRQAAIDWSLLLEKQGRQPAYVYTFCRDLPGEALPADPETGKSGEMPGAFHSSELWYMFGTLGNSWRPMEAGDFELSERMVSYWTNFAKTGNPNGEGLPEWAPCTAADNHVQNLDILE